MKNLKLGFASIVAILALSLTIAAQAGAFETKAAPRDVNCYTLKVQGLGTIEYNRGAGQSCETATQVLVNKCLISTPTTLVDPQFACPGTQFFCCATLIADASCPSGQKIQQVFCRNQP